MPMKMQTLRPGYLVSIKTEIKGGCEYNVTDEQEEKEGDAKLRRWTTENRVENAEEWEKAKKARASARQQITRICSATAFGNICPKNRGEELEKAIGDARKITDDFNATSEHSEVRIYVLKGEIADNDEEALKSIASEVRDLLGEMNGAIDRLNPEEIRKAASKMRQLQAVLAPEQSAIVQGAIEQARDAARSITKRIGKDAELAEVVLADIRRDQLDQARMAFLDFDAPAEVLALPAVALQRMDAIDLSEEKDEESPKTEALPSLDMPGLIDIGSDDAIAAAGPAAASSPLEV